MWLFAQASSDPDLTRALTIFLMVAGAIILMRKAGKVISDNKTTIAKEGWSFFRGFFR